MLTTQNETSEKELLERISLARNPSEPQVEPTEEAEQEPVEQEVDELPEETEQEEAAETEELDDEPEPTDEPDEELYIDLDGEEIALSEVKKWKEGDMRQSDYTKKTTALAEERKAFEAEKVTNTKLQTALKEKLATVEAILAEETLSAEQLQELREDDPDEFIKYQEKLNKRQQAIQSSKGATVDREKVNKALIDANPEWVKDGKSTEKFTQDMALVRDYTAGLGYSNEELAGIEQNGDSHHWLTLLDAAKGREAIKKLAEINSAAEKKRSRKAPIVTKPRGKGQSNLERQIEQAQAKFKSSGDINDAYALKKLQKQRGNT